MIKNLFFDMGGVVFRQNSQEAYRRFREAGIDPAQYMGDYGQRGFFLDVETGRIDAAAFCRKMAAAAGRDSVSFAEAQHCWLGYVVDVPVGRLHRLLELRRDYRVCLLSNTNPFIMDYMRSERFSDDRRPITDYFDRLFCSYEMHAYKPDAAIFRQALSADGLSAEESVFIDDSRKNVDAAAALGFKTLHVTANADWTGALNTLLAQGACAKL